MRLGIAGHADGIGDVLLLDAGIDGTWRALVVGDERLAPSRARQSENNREKRNSGVQLRMIVRDAKSCDAGCRGSMLTA